MKRSLRAFSATVFKLEERALLATLTPPPAPPTSTTEDVGFSAVTQEVSQQSSVATVILSRGIATGSGSNYLPFLQVQVTTDSSSPYVGVNVGAVNQTVTFAPNQIDAMLTVPIVAGAPNPGEVDVNLTVTPVDPSPDLNVSAPVDMLRILASDASIPPTIVATVGTPDGIEVIFNKPMDPAQASKVKNYAVSSEGVNFGSSGFIPTFHMVTTSVRLMSAEYNAATNTVTLIPRRRLTYGAQVTVTQGRPAHAAGGPSAGTGAARGLVDLEGQPINQTTTPGKFSVSVYKGYGTPSFNL
jgi:hypothetical protein